MFLSDLSEIETVDINCEGKRCGSICGKSERNGLCTEEGECQEGMVNCGMNTFS